MARYVAWVFAALLLVPATGSAEGLCDRGQNQGKPGSPAGQTDAKPDQGHPPKWWIDPKLRNELGITDQQSTAIEAVWSKDYKQRAETWKRLDELEKKLDRMMLDASADESAIVTQLDRVEAVRTEVSKARVIMLYRINKLLTPEQRIKLDAMAKERRGQRPGDGRRNRQ
jgi:Spy/CpxP family protein refolding chaperone